MSRRPPGVPGWVVVVAVALLTTTLGLAAGLLLGTGMSPAAAQPAEGSVNVGFARAMREHHAQAVQMSTLVREATTDPEVDTLALDVLLTQQHQAGQMYAWLADWNLPPTGSGPPLAWMRPAAADDGTDATAGEHGGGGHDRGGMPGMASAADLARLAELTGRDAERLYLQLMIPHHQAGVAMGRVAAAEAADPQVRQLAQAIVDSQAAEITALRDMLAARGGPLPRG